MMPTTAVCKPTVFEDENPGWIDLGGSPFLNPGSGYQSPWDIWFRNDPFTPGYTFSNRGGGGHTSPLKLEIIPWVGLAYFDDNDDGDYTDLNLVQPGNNGIVADLTNGNYPLLYAHNQEVGNFIPGDAITLDGSNIDESELTIVSDPAATPDEHLLVNAVNKHPSGYNNLNKVFSFSSATPQEQDLLMKYGKVFYYEVRITERVSGNYIGTYYVQYRNKSLEYSYQNYIKIPGYASNTSHGGNVYYYLNQTPGAPNETQWVAPYPVSDSNGNPNPNYICNSREVVIDQVFPDTEKFSYGGTNWRVIVGMAIGSHLWRTSGPMLIVGPN